MKKSIFFLLIMGIALIAASIPSVNAASCDQTFYFTLRHGKTYNFYDDWNNTDTRKTGLNNVVTTFTEQRDYNGGSNPTFGWTSWIKNKGYIINPYESGRVVEASKNYPISYVPVTRSYNNLKIDYKATFYKQETNGTWSGPWTHTECANYMITWCGDGVVDAGYETCDPKDPSKKNWGNGGCSYACNPVTINPTCTQLTATPNSGDAPLTSNLSCIGTNAKSYKINVKNSAGTVIKTINGKSGSYTFTNTGNYSATCYVDGTITSDSCTKPITVKEEVKTCDTLTVNPSVGDSPLTSSFACSGTNISKYKINILDGNGTVINTINTQTGSYTFTQTGSYEAICYVDDTITSNSCKKPITVKKEGTETTCNGLDLSPKTGVNSLTSTAVCSGTNVDTYKIDCGNSQIFTGTGSGVGTESFTETCSYSSKGTYTPRCYINETITNNSCSDTVSVTTSSSSSSSSSGGGPRCIKISSDNSTLSSSDRDIEVTCEGNNRVKTFKVDCGNNQAPIVGAAIETLRGKNFITTCSYPSNQETYKPKCYVSGSLETDPSRVTRTSNSCGRPITVTSSSSSSGGSSSSSSGGGSYCGDGVIQRPNSDGENEECEKIVDSKGKIGSFPDFCSSSCKIKTSTMPKSCYDGNCVITIPGEGEINFGPEDNVLIGHGANPYKEYLVKPYIENNSSYELYFDELCISKVEGNTLLGKSVQCKSLGNSPLYPGEKVSFSAYPVITGNVNTIPSGKDYGDNKMVTTIKNNGELYDWAFFTTPFEIRVSKPSIVSIGGGTSYLGDSSTIADTSNVAEKNKDENKNFVGAGVSTGSVSSFSKDVTDSGSVSDIGEEGTTYEDSLNDVVDEQGTASSTTSDILEFESYNGLDNVFIIKNTNFEFDETTLDGLRGARTYIIENGDMTIKGDILYNYNVAFVVKGGNIRIEENVETINGTYITIKKSDTKRGGKIVGIGGETNNVLKVYGALYGNVKGLVAKRVYVRYGTSYQVNVGTIVSFGSSVFRQPAPLTSMFINEYLESEKVAQ